MKSGKLPSVLQDSDDDTSPDPEALHHRNQSSLNRDILRTVFCLQRDDRTPPHGIEIVDGIEQEYRDKSVDGEDGGINKSAVYDRLTDLTHSGLIEKHNSTRDGRRKTYHLTEHGEEVLKEYYQTIHTQLGSHFNFD